jgi:hypothetical protein
MTMAFNIDDLVCRMATRTARDELRRMIAAGDFTSPIPSEEYEQVGRVLSYSPWLHTVCVRWQDGETLECEEITIRHYRQKESIK